MPANKYEHWETVEVDRAEVKNAPYNPRVIDKHARKKLRESLKKHGQVEPLVWNRRTGNMVGGNQRLSILDDLHGGQAYRLTVAAIDVDEAEEKALCVLLNNQSVAGNYDLALLEPMVRELGHEALGFDFAEVQMMFDASDLGEHFDSARDSAQEDIEALKAQRKKYLDRAHERDDTEFYLVVIFASRQEAERFARAADIDPNERYVDGRALASLLDLDLDQNPEPAELTGAKV